MGIVRIQVEDILTLKKTHPCGSREWRVTRLGVDIGLKCQGCNRFVMVPRRELERKIREIRRGEERLKPQDSRIEV